jgi:hypothetical protein
LVGWDQFFSAHLIVTGIRNPGVGESPIALPHAGIARHEAVAWQESAAGLHQQWTQWHDSSSPLQSFASWTSKLIPASHSRLKDICILAPTQKRIVSFETKYPQGPKSQLFCQSLCEASASPAPQKPKSLRRYQSDGIGITASKPNLKPSPIGAQSNTPVALDSAKWHYSGLST